jgi:hypothetical protein
VAIKGRKGWHSSGRNRRERGESHLGWARRWAREEKGIMDPWCCDQRYLGSLMKADLGHDVYTMTMMILVETSGMDETLTCL